MDFSWYTIKEMFEIPWLVPKNIDVSVGIHQHLILYNLILPANHMELINVTNQMFI